MEEEKIKEVVWSAKAIKQLQLIVKYLLSVSEFAVNRVTEDVEKKTVGLSKNYNNYRKDELRVNNDGTYRVCFVFSYRISYKITKDKVLILAIRHTSRVPIKL